MPANFIKLESIGDLDRLFARSSERPVALFKHSNSCGISSHVLEMVGEIEGDVFVLVIQEHRNLSAEIAARTGYAHQSPQAFVINDGKTIYHATHYGIDPHKITNLLLGQIESVLFSG